MFQNFNFIFLMHGKKSFKFPDAELYQDFFKKNLVEKSKLSCVKKIDQLSGVFMDPRAS